MPPQQPQPNFTNNPAPNKKSYQFFFILGLGFLLIAVNLWFLQKQFSVQIGNDNLPDLPDQGIAPYNRGVRGVVIIGPVCPVQRIPPDPDCADKPYQARLRIKNQAGKAVIDSVVNKDGTFKFDLPPGEYTITNANKDTLPNLAPVSFFVEPNSYTEINLQFDSGIR